MSLLSRIRHWLSGERRTVDLDERAPQVRALEASVHETLQPNNANQPYWSRATGADADSTTTPAYRANARNRARMEVTNNSYARGITLTLANDTIGTGPRLQIVPENGNQEAANRLEETWQRWFNAARMPSKLHTMKLSKTVDGEAFSVLETNLGLDHEVKLDMGIYEADFFATPWHQQYLPQLNTRYPLYDGIEFDTYGNPDAYWRSKVHPGSTYAYLLSLDDYDRLPADSVMHWYRMDRPGQHRGLCEIVAVLDLFVDLRDYTDAAVNAAQQAASMQAAMKTDMPPGEGDEVTDPVCTQIPIPKNSLFNLPSGWELQQMRVEQPTTVYPDFVKQVLKEIARCLSIPAAVALGDSSDHNYASGRLDYQVYYQAIDVERRWIERYILEKVFNAWLEEAMFIPGALPRIGPFKKRWIWDARPPIDVLKEAQAVVALFNAGLLLEGKHWSDQYGLGLDEARAALRADIEFRRQNDLPLPQSLVTQLSQAPQDERTVTEPDDE